MLGLWATGSTPQKTTTQVAFSVALQAPRRPPGVTVSPPYDALQWRASLGNPGDRDALLANPDAIALPIEQIENGCVFVAERDGDVAGFAAVVPRSDGGAELDALFVEPHLWNRGIGRHGAAVHREYPGHIRSPVM